MSYVKYNILLIAVSVLLYIAITLVIINIFGKISDVSILPSFTIQLSTSLIIYTFPIILSWITGAAWCSIIFIILSIGICLLTAVKTGNNFYLFYLGYFVFLFLILAWEHKRKKNMIVLYELDAEKIIEEKNIIEQTLTEKTRALEIFLHKYANYSKLKNVIEKI